MKRHGQRKFYVARCEATKWGVRSDVQCSKQAGHSGEHVVTGMQDQILARWPATDARKAVRR